MRLRRRRRRLYGLLLGSRRRRKRRAGDPRSPRSHPGPYQTLGSQPRLPITVLRCQRRERYARPQIRKLIFPDPFFACPESWPASAVLDLLKIACRPMAPNQPRCERCSETVRGFAHDLRETEPRRAIPRKRAWRNALASHPALPMPISAHRDQAMAAKCCDTVRFRAHFTFCAVETGLAG